MSLNEETARVQIVVSTATDIISFPYPFIDAADLLVVSDGRGTLVKDTDYTVAGEGDEAGGTVTLIDGVPTENITIVRSTEISQLLQLLENGPFPSTSIEASLDKVTKILQDLAEEVARCLKMPVGETNGYVSELLDATSRASRYLAFNSNGALVYAEGTEGNGGALPNVVPVTYVVTSSYTVLDTDRWIMVNDDTAGGPVTINLLNAGLAGDGFPLVVKKLGTTGDVTVDAYMSQTIDEQLTEVITVQNAARQYVCDGSEWRVLNVVPTIAEVTAASNEPVGSQGIVDYAQPRTGNAEWVFSTNTTEEDPASGNFRFNNSTQSLATEMYVSKTTSSGKTTDLSSIEVGQVLNIVQEGANTRWIEVEVSNLATDNTTWVKVPITVRSNGLAIQNNAECAWSASVTPASQGVSSVSNQRAVTKTVSTSTYTVTESDRVLLFDDDAVAGDITVTMPDASVVGDGWAVVLKKLGNTGRIIVGTVSSQEIDGETTRTITSAKEAVSVISDGSDWQVLFPSRNTGWAFYDDNLYTSGSTLAVNAAKVELTCNGSGSQTNTSYLPQGVQDFWDTTNNKIIPQKVGDAYDIRLDFVADPAANGDWMEVVLDIGTVGTPIEVVRRSVSFTKSTPQSISIGFPIFALSTFLANGGKFYLDTSESGDNINIYDISIYIKRDHSPI